MNLSSKVALVTGAAKGMGRAIALALARQGAAVGVADIDVQGAWETVNTIIEAGGNAVAIEVDVAHRSSIDRMIELTVERLQRIDILVNNAGIIGYMPALSLSETEWDRVLAVNLKGCFFCAQCAAAAMISARTMGVIINITSISAALPEPDCVHYGVSKAGVEHLTKSLALALGAHGIRVIAVAPGTIHTVMNNDLLRMPAFVNERLKVIPVGRIGTPEEVAEVVAFLASDGARYITGSTVYVDGGTMLLR